MNLIEKMATMPSLQPWLKTVSGRQLVVGLGGSAKALAMASYWQRHPQQILVVTPNLYYANQLAEDLRHVLPDDRVHTFPVDEVLAAEMAFASPEARSERVATLNFLRTQEPGFIIASVAAVRKYLPPVTVWDAQKLFLKVGGELALTDLPQKLVSMGYQREDLVANPGEFAIRGSIVDIYPLDTEYPLRLELFDTEIDSLRYFDPERQSSLRKLEEALVLPTTEMILAPAALKTAAEKLRAALNVRLTVATKKAEVKQLTTYFEDIASQWDNGNLTDYDKLYPDFLYPEKTTLLDYLGTASVFVDDLARIYETEQQIEKESAQWFTQQLAELRVFPHQVLQSDFRQFLKKAPQNQTFFALFQKGMGNLRFEHIFPLQMRTMQQFFGQLPLLKAEMDRWLKQKQSILILVPTKERLSKVEEMLREVEIPAVVTSPQELLPQGVQGVQIIEGALSNGFELVEDRLVVITEREIFHTTTKKRKRPTRISNAERIKSYTDLKTGDFVVHANHGIGQYVGMQTLEVDGVHQDYITILYQNNDKLFIPVTQLNLIQKYVSSEAKTPKVNKLGGTEWTKTKRKVTAKIEDIADELIELYAKREAEKGYAFSKDDAYQQEFEADFPYSETDDQIRSIAEIKKDMEKTRPMDRLLVGDVGYGKTEVALRAAFKAIQDHKQVAFLVPTTILAQQHFETMEERFRDYPVNIGVLSRFRTKKQQNETLQALKRGEVDIVVGTHRLLSKDVEFADLGLLIVDEEQRFGVKHKERLKQLRSQVDVLTLTATPIPRTLHMSMLGVRDLSVIETPPENRYPVQTYVMEKNLGAIREGIQREMARGGQIFYLYNRVETIDQKVAEIQELVPEARIAFAHGQMSEVQLENVLLDFIDGQFDVLVTTTIIETGVNITNVNTLFVENADYMGLSTLYQLRGRVGRTNRIAYAYFMYEPQKVLNEVSEKRLQAIKDFTELGSGFKIAMRDLSIRGAGNLLGSQQHGFIDAVGFDMYTQMLEEAVQRKQGKAPTESKSAVEIELGVDAYIPDSYLKDQRQKIEIYKRLRQLETLEMLNELIDDLIDRFGDYPEEVNQLLFIGQLKMDGDRALVESMRRKDNTVTFTLTKAGTNTYTVEQIFKALQVTKLKAALGVEKEKMQIRFTLPKNQPMDIWLQELVDFTRALRQEKLQKQLPQQLPQG
ncbi:transcription-repair coupling factor [Enterococcus nangangensis]|uniref:transcription-repair coupling factor n=1 Tax=Enterococcus nangangensis TaxID=2559926 RepID=UPI0010F53778|nr:transcription-repair coupling factor [Enterococcus nangangensis]